MKYRKLGRTDIAVSAVCCGTMAMTPHPTYGQPDDAASIGAIHAALDAGVNFFDTAEAYGNGYAEDLLGRALQGRRDRAIIATKVSPAHLRPEDLKRSCEASLARLRTEYIDLYQVHWPNREVPFAETAGALEELKRQGKVRAWGVSNFGKSDLSDALAVGRPEVNQLHYSLLWRVIEHEVLPLCLEHGVSVICYSPLAQGILTGKFQTPDQIPPQRRRARYCRPDLIGRTFAVLAELRAVSEELGEPMADVALAWLLAQPGVTAVIAGARTADHVRQNARAARLNLPGEIVDRLTLASAPPQEALDKNPDMWQEGEESRYR